MLEVSTEWANASRDQFRYQAYLRTQLNVVPPGMREGAVVTSSDSSIYSDPDKVTDALTAVPTDYTTLENNRLVLNGSQDVLTPSVVTDDWWSEEQNTAVLHFDFDSLYTIPGVYITWDTRTNSYATDFVVRGYNVDGDLSYNTTVTGGNSTAGFFSTPMENISALELEVTGWSNPDWRVRVTEIMFGLVIGFDSINNGRITGAESYSTSDPLSSVLPNHNFKVSLRNLDNYFDPTFNTGVSPYLAVRQEFNVQWGFRTDKDTVEWTNWLPYFVKSFSIPKDSGEVEMTMTNRLSLLTGSFKQGTWTGTDRSISSLVDYVLENSGIMQTSDGQQPWTCSDSMGTYTTKAPIPTGVVKELMQLYAQSACTWLTIDGSDGYVLFKESLEDNVEGCDIGLAQQFGDPSVTIQEQLKSVTIGIYSYTEDTENANKEISKTETKLYGTNTLEIKYNVDYATDVAVTVTGATLVSSTKYASYAYVTVTAATAGADVTITIKGTEVVQSVLYLKTYNDPQVVSGLDLVIENPIITETDMALAVATRVKNYYLKRTRYEIEYQGYVQLEPVDKINLDTIYGDSDVEIKSAKITYDGGWKGIVGVV